MALTKKDLETIVQMVGSTVAQTVEAQRVASRGGPYRGTDDGEIELELWIPEKGKNKDVPHVSFSIPGGRRKALPVDAFRLLLDPKSKSGKALRKLIAE